MTLKQREIWFDGRGLPLERYDLWSLVNNSPLETILVTPGQRLNGHFPQKTRFITEIQNEADLQGLNPGELVYSDRA
ncbi:MAG TPA: hypothetical protein VEC37_01970, partial [Bacillota bacterium]|nr:hypothetical protein [Bacillota bacterium]